MSARLWIGFGFLAALVLFLMITFLREDRASANQYKNMRLLNALCAGFAGGFLSGEALFQLNQEWSGAKLVVSGSLGCALFFTVWFGYGKVVDRPLRDSMRINIPEGWTFEHTVRTIAESVGAVADFEGFTPEQLSAVLPATHLNVPTPQLALANLRFQPGSCTSGLVGA